MTKGFKILILLLISMSLSVSCNFLDENNIDRSENSNETFSENEINNNQSNQDIDKKIDFNVINFRTSEDDSLKQNNLIINNYDEFLDYIEQYKIIENPFFIEKENLDILESIDEKFFSNNALIVSVFVENNPDTIVKGENIIIKDNVGELFIKREETNSQINETATRHVVFILNNKDIKNIEKIKIKTTL